LYTIDEEKQKEMAKIIMTTNEGRSNGKKVARAFGYLFIMLGIVLAFGSPIAGGPAIVPWIGMGFSAFGLVLLKTTSTKKMVNA